MVTRPKKRHVVEATSAPVEKLRSVKTKHHAWGQRAASGVSTYDPFRVSVRPFLEAASSSPRLTQVPDAGPNSHNVDIEKARRMSRWMYMNDPFFRQACRQIGNNVVHYGIKPNIRDKALAKIWKKFVKEIDARGQADFYGLQHMSPIVAARDGDHFFRIRRRRPGEMRSGINFQLQSLEADHVPLNETRQLSDGDMVISGVETNAIDRVTAYWMHDYHPQDLNIVGGASMPKRVPADQVLHIYMPERFSDRRGYPWGTSALTTADRYRTYDTVELERKIMASTKGGYFKKPRIAGDEESVFEDGEEILFRPMEPGEYVQVPEGWDIEETQPAATDSNYASYRRESLSGLAVAFGFAVELVTMNWEKLASDRQYRGLMLEIVRYIESIQYHMMVFRLCQPVWELFVSEAFVNGLWKPAPGKDLEDYFDVEWIAPKRGYIHPVQDVTAVSMAIEKGLESRKRAVSGNGEDVEDIDFENAEDTARAKKMGLRYSMFGLDGEVSTPSAAVAVGDGQTLVDPETGEEVMEMGSPENVPA